ncbi:MAG: PEGA domain-containing protein [Phycisphaerales bacterium]|nr:PEGA domain-containing protein [Phycisphaerales bacterium]
MRCLSWASVVLIGSSISLVGCGTIIHGSSQTVMVSSQPPGATISVDNGMVLTTPSSVKLERKRDYVLTISKPGYMSQTVPINSVLSGWLAGNIIFGGLIGGGVDLASGAAYTLTPAQISITLQPLAAGQQDTGIVQGAMTTQQKLDALESLRAQGVVTEKEYEASKAKLNEDLKREIRGS